MIGDHLFWSQVGIGDVEERVALCEGILQEEAHLLENHHAQNKVRVRMKVRIRVRRITTFGKFWRFWHDSLSHESGVI